MATPSSPYRKHTRNRSYYNIEVTTTNLKSQPSTLTALIKILTCTNDLFREYSKAIESLNPTILPLKVEPDTGTETIVSFFKESKKIANEMHNHYMTIQEKMIDPLIAFSKDYDIMYNKLNKESEVIVKAISDNRYNCKKDKETYLGVAKEFSTSQRLIKHPLNINKSTQKQSKNFYIR